jgi:DNA-binding NarL/FixJ family response regulator
MIVLILTAIIATDIAVAVLFLAVRRHLSGPAPAEAEALAAEAEELAAGLRAQAEQAAAELRRQRLHLHQLLAGLERRTAAPAPVSRREVMDLVAEGLPFRTIAARTGLSVEEVRLMVAMDEDARRAA